MKIEFSPSYSPWSNRLNERNHYSTERMVRKIIDENTKMSPKEVVGNTAWTQYTNIMIIGISKYHFILILYLESWPMSTTILASQTIGPIRKSIRKK